jgi:signal transduction histidine kinase
MMMAMRVRRIGVPITDVGLALAVAALGQAEVWANARIHPRGAAAACELVLGIALAWRRRFALATMLVVGIASTVEALAGVPLQEPLVPLVASVIAIYSLVSTASAERAFAGAVIGLTAIAIQTASQHKGVGNFLFGLVFLLAAWVGGRTVHARTSTAEQLEHEQEAREAAAAAEERRRIARELHDIVSHNLAMLVVQAGAAEQLLERDPQRAREALRAIRATGHEAIGEMGTLLSLVRGPTSDLRDPQPSLADLERLIEKTSEAGLAVELEIEGQRVLLATAVELSAYRIVQEGLTNALKHAGGAKTRVVIRFRPEELELEVSDDGSRANGVSGSGRGLAGMRERVEVFGGHLTAGPRPDGGWTLRATLPLPR